MIKATENPGGFQVPLNAHEFECTHEVPLRDRCTHRRMKKPVIIRRPFRYAICRPPDVAILEQRHEVIGHRALDRILKIEHAGIFLARHHQVSRMVIPVHKHLWLLHCVAHEHVAERLPRGLFRYVEFHSEVGAAQPVVEQRQFEAQQFLVVRRQP